ncbi:MAG: polysaccharide deacetylase family protein [Rhodocyclaceae bacterium]|nr:polysaccharide deacetylase family protein [Rhodocyclaceae bacterium]
MLGPAIRLASRRGDNARLSILIFHRVLSEPDPLFPGEICAESFEQIVKWLSAWFKILPLSQGIERLAAGTLPRGSAAITFDDGYADNLLHAQPILERHHACATLFVAAGFLDGGIMWNDRIIEAVRRSGQESLSLPELGVGALSLEDIAARRVSIDTLIGRLKYLEPEARDDAVGLIVERSHVELPSNLMLTSEQLRDLHDRGMDIGAHTVNHPILARTSPNVAKREIGEGRDRLEGLIGERVSLFAYPNGRPGTDYLPEHVALVESFGFDAAVSTSWGVSSQSSPRFELPRFTPWDRTRTRFGARLFANFFRT